MTKAESAHHFARELEWVGQRVRNSEAGEPEIETLVNVIRIIREATPTTSTEEEITRRYLAAKQEEEMAAAAVAAHFWPLVKACKTEKEARDLMARVPGGCVEKAFMWDYFTYESKIVPRRQV